MRVRVNDEAEFAVISTMQMKRSAVFRHYTNSGKCRATGRLHHSLGPRLGNRWAWDPLERRGRRGSGSGALSRAFPNGTVPLFRD